MLSIEQTDFRDVDLEILNEVELIVIDVSFISLTKLISKISKIKSVKEIVCLVKPQFEVGKEIANKYKGIINNKNEHIKVLDKIVMNFSKINFHPKNISFSPIKGGDGNIEYLIYFTKNNKKIFNYEIIVCDAFEKLK